MVQRFTQAHRLKKADEFSSVFLFRKSRSGVYFKIYFKPNELPNSRLGLITSKRIAKRANKRNYMKRTVREFFRCSNANWSRSYDVVVKVLKLFTHDNYHDVRNELQNLTKSFYK